jgi:hypothetical protein
VSDEIRDEETEAQEEDVEGHGPFSPASGGSPSSGGEPLPGRSDDEGDDVEAHGLAGQPNVNQPNVN